MTRVLLISLAFSSFAAAQSFDCKLAKSPREHAVCSDESLAALDSAVSVAYKSLRANLSPQSAALVQSDQREWLQWIELVCPTRGKGIASDMNRCLSQEYTNRERDLKNFVKTGTMRIFLRSHFLYKAGSSSEEPLAGNDPGFGYGSLRWPQIDIQGGRSNTATYEKWNSAVKSRARKLAVGINPQHKDATFDTAVDVWGTVEGFYTVEAANDRFIDVSLVDMGYGWGAAHPLTSQTSFLWWLDRNRELTVSDIFIPRSGWEDKLSTSALSNLTAQPDLKGMLGADVEEVKKTVSDVTAWTPTRDGLTITFGQYEIGPYAIGMPKARILWSDLKAYLAPYLEPTTLPGATFKGAR